MELVISTENSERVVAIDNEASIRLAADNSLAADIVTEEQSRISGDSSLETKIELEATARASADTVHQTSINNEASTRLSADASLTSAIETEKGRIDVILEGSDVNLDQFHEVVTFINSIDVLNDETLVGIETSQNLRVSTEETTRASADASLTTRISNEESTSTSAYASLTTRVSNEEVNRVDGDASLETELSTSVSALNSRIEAEMSTEVEARENGDNSLTDMIRVNEQTMNSVDASLAAFISTVESKEADDVASLEEADQSLEAYVDDNVAYLEDTIASLETRASIAENIFFTKVTYLGDIDGVNTNFSIVENVYNYETLQVYLNGLLQEEGEDFEVSQINSPGSKSIVVESTFDTGNNGLQPGTTYTEGTYPNVSLGTWEYSSGAAIGEGVVANVTVTFVETNKLGGPLLNITYTIVEGGSGYKAGDEINVNPTDIGISDPSYPEAVCQYILLEEDISAGPEGTYIVFNEAPAATSRVTMYVEIDDNEPSVPEGGGDGDGLSGM